MLVVGLTGGIGSGKSAASAQFEALGRPIIDADIIAREVVEPGEAALTRIVEHFGPAILSDNGSLDRAHLRETVFSDTKSREWLEQLLHPIIRHRIMDKIDSYQGMSPFIILASPLLLETDQHKMVDHVVVIDLPENLQVERAASRDANNEEQIKRIMAAQLSRQARLDLADSVLENGSTLDNLKNQIKLLDIKLRELAVNEYRV
ncbi:dephospho-CoA kinase [Neptunomonas qingdaonensis]|uniref:Dephospho-CoA kinase n=2 Tax=Neptunomonas qingdaonensis TaxID=1045558 RepID=A0A1I2TGL9_9GAMM|nr:dephospho-CoA kinase [Neptunomonas qingdaonensis]SFG64035.1 dephospho-CoA kinase [Neptunomonas qingdaonensis]